MGLSQASNNAGCGGHNRGDGGYCANDSSNDEAAKLFLLFGFFTKIVCRHFGRGYFAERYIRYPSTDSADGFHPFLDAALQYDPEFPPTA